jgi:hypothetical protein
VASAPSRGYPIRTCGPTRPDPATTAQPPGRLGATTGCCRHRRASAPAQIPTGPIPAWSDTSTTTTITGRPAGDVHPRTRPTPIPTIRSTARQA